MSTSVTDAALPGTAEIRAGVAGASVTGVSVPKTSATSTAGLRGAGVGAVSRRRMPIAALLALVLLAGLGILLALNTASAAQELRQRSLSQSNSDTADTEQQLLRDLAKKQAPSALASSAVALGLIPNSNPAFLQIQPDGSVKVLGMPAPASLPPTPTPTVSVSPTVTPAPAPASVAPAAVTPAAVASPAVVSPATAVSPPAARAPAATAPAAAVQPPATAATPAPTRTP